MKYKYNFLKILILFSTVLLLTPSFCFATDTNSLAIESPAAILIHSDTGTVLYEKEASTRMFPASTTKIMTAILVLESGHALSENAVVSQSAVSSISDIYSHASLQAGEQFSLEQLLHVLLIASANDAANVLAEYIAGSLPAFADMMNKKAIEIGCTNTHFVNPSGIHSDDHYSTAYDLSLIGRYAMQNNTFRKIVNKTSCSLPTTEKYPNEDRTFANTNALLMSNSSYYYPYAIGIKTGFTTPAGNCLVAGGMHDGLEFITVVLGSFENNEISQRYSDTKKLFDFAYSNYSIRPLRNKNDVVGVVEISNATADTKDLNILCDKDISVFMNVENEVFPEIILKESLLAPIQVGDIVGNIKYNVSGTSYEANLIAGNNVEKETFSPLIVKIIMGSISILILIGIFFGTRKPKVEEIDLFR